ncbi:MAG: PAS domain S-box protein [Melioribacteraceae bacterium]|nr:PAS domain S-box protein [Melioribacteraceae bacterium]
MAAKNKPVTNGKRKFVWLYVVIAVIFTISAYFYYREEETVLIKQKQSELESIAKLKINQISKWYSDEKVDTEILSHNTFLIREIQQTLLTGEPSSFDALTQVLQNIKVEHDYADIILTTPDAEIITSTNPSLKNLDSSLSQKIFETTNSNKIVELDFFRSNSLGDKILLGFIAPIRTEINAEQLSITFLIDPEDNIYHSINHWPVTSTTSETFFFRIEDGSIIYLNELRHRKNTALEFVLPMSLSHLPAAKAAEGYTGIYRGKDYRNVNVVAYVSDIPKTNWYIVAKVDERELFAGLFARMMALSLIVLLLMIITGIGLYLIYSNRQNSLTKRLYKKEKELWRQQEKFRITMDSLGEGVITLDVDGKVQYLNNMAEDLTGWDLRSARGRDLHEVYQIKNEQTGFRENNILEKILKYGLVKELANHTILITRDGREIPVIDTGAPAYDADSSIIGVSIVFQDETDRRKQARRIKDSEERLRSTLDDLIEGCQIIGFDYEYLYLNKAALVSSRKTIEELMGNSMVECYPGIENTEMFSKLKNSMETREPINFENEFEYLNGEKRIFNLRFEPVPEGLFILSEDITNLKSAQDFIVRLRMGIELSGEAVYLTDVDGVITYVNPAFEKIFGYSKEEVIGKTPRVLQSGTQSIEFYENFWKDLIANKPVNCVIINKTKDNRLIYIEASINPINDETGKIVGYLAIERDVTERKLSEEKQRQLTTILEATPDFVAIADSNGSPIFTNTAGKKMLGLAADFDEKQISIAESHPEWARNIVLEEGIPTAAKEGIWRGETALLHRDGSETPISQIIVAHKSADGVVKYFSTIGRDITERKLYEEELIEKTTLLESFFQNTLTSIALLDKSYNYIRVNEAYANAEGRTVDFYIGNNHFDLHSDDTKEIFKEVVKSKTSYYTIERPFFDMNNSNREISYWDWSLVPLLDVEGEVESLIFTLLNVTDRVKSKEKLMKNEKFLSKLFDSVNDAIFTVSMRDRKIQRINKAVLELFGCDQDELIGKGTQVLFSSKEEFLKYGTMITEAKNENKPFVRAELKLLRKDRTKIYCDVQTSFLRETGTSDMVISVLRDITEKREMINELIASKEKAEEMNLLKTNFLANMSHELRTPLIGINGFADLLMQDLEEPDLKEMAENIYNSGNRLSETLNLILDLSKFETENVKFNYEKIDLIKETDETLNLFSKVAEKKGLYLKSTYSHPSIIIYTDERAYRTILNNLINNAIKFTREGGVIVDVSVKENHTEIKVKDTGIGISEEYLKTIFEEFRQVSEGMSRNFEGTGLGLNITKKLVEKFGGEIYVESEPGKGATFHVKLPFATDVEITEEQITNNQPEKKYVPAKKTVKPLALLVDDDPIVYPVLKRYISGQVDLERVEDARSAIKLCETKKYDLIFMDINLKQGMDGKEATRVIRKLKGYEIIPIVAATAYVMPGDKEEFLEAGCSHYISKPFQRQDISNLVDAILREV